MKEVEVDSESEPSEDSTNSDNPEKNKPNDYEKLRDLRVSQNKAKLEALGLKNIANSLVNLRQNKGKGKTTQLRRSKRVSKSSKIDDDDYDHDDEDDNDDEYKPNNDDDDDDNDDDDEYVRNYGSNSKKKSADIPDFMDEDEALKQAIALSLNEFGETPNQRSRDNNTRKKKSFKNRVQMNEDDVVINFCQFDEIGKGSITLRDLERMAASHDFTWTDKELADMIRCFDSDKDGKLTLDDFRTIILRCNMLQTPQNP